MPCGGESLRLHSELSVCVSMTYSFYLVLSSHNPSHTVASPLFIAQPSTNPREPSCQHAQPGVSVTRDLAIAGAFRARPGTCPSMLWVWRHVGVMVGDNVSAARGASALHSSAAVGPLALPVCVQLLQALPEQHTQKTHVRLGSLIMGCTPTPFESAA